MEHTVIRLRIANMTCGGCASGVAATLREADPHAEPSFDLDRREVSVANTTREAAALLRALADEGWEAALIPA